MRFKENEVVRIISDGKSIVKKGDIGTIIMVFDHPHEAYEVEFLDADGRVKTQCVFLPDEMEKL